jgi:hypothetical protein
MDVVCAFEYAIRARFLDVLKEAWANKKVIIGVTTNANCVESPNVTCKVTHFSLQAFDETITKLVNLANICPTHTFYVSIGVKESANLFKKLIGDAILPPFVSGDARSELPTAEEILSKEKEASNALLNEQIENVIDYIAKRKSTHPGLFVANHVSAPVENPERAHALLSTLVSAYNIIVNKAFYDPVTRNLLFGVLDGNKQCVYGIVANYDNERNANGQLTGKVATEWRVTRQNFCFSLNNGLDDYMYVRYGCDAMNAPNALFPTIACDFAAWKAGTSPHVLQSHLP